MSLVIDIDPHGTPRIPFSDMRSRLLTLGRVFDEADLRALPYDQICLAAMANAGDAACSLDLVVAEKRRRRYRFLHLCPDEFEKAKPYLEKEKMLPELKAELIERGAPEWHQLTVRARLWFKLNCLYTHIDLPDERLREAYYLATRCEQQGFIKPDNAKRILDTLDRLLWLYPDAIDDESFRTTLGALTEQVLGYLDDNDKMHCQREMVRDYSCTSNCYHAMGALR